VKGHQDKVKKYSELTQPEWFNIDADESATKKMRFEMTESALQLPHFRNINVYIQDQLISSSLDTRLMEMFTVDDYWTYYEKKYD
jgi:L-lysine 2,3-aminomutase